MCNHLNMPTDDDAVVRDFIERLDRGEVNGHLAEELPKLSYRGARAMANVSAPLMAPPLRT